jgi:hypothetical protein
MRFGYFATMPRERSLLEIICPNCGASGNASVSENPEFEVEKYPDGFSEEQRATSHLETRVRCKCGQEFYLL